MKRIAIIGAGIVGATAAYQLTKHDVELVIYDEGVGQATKAAAGIICPWLSQRRNKDWYRLTARGAAYYPELMTELAQDDIEDLPYEQVGAFVFKKTEALVDKLEQIALSRREEAPMIGTLTKVSPEEVAQTIPGWAGSDGAIHCSGGGRVDGQKLVDQLLTLAQQRGAQLIHEHVTLSRGQQGEILVQSLHGADSYDYVIVSSGAWVKSLIEPLGYEVDVRPQKGQLLELALPGEVQTEEWPVCMLHGEIDILPFADGRIIVGATHENDKGFDLTPDEAVLQRMYEEACEVFPALHTAKRIGVRVGTRAYTSDFLPFFGRVPGASQLLVASGLGSSGLTSGVWIGHLLAQIAFQGDTDFDLTPYAPDAYIQTR